VEPMGEMKKSVKKNRGLSQALTIVFVVLVIGGVFFAISKSHEILAWVASQQNTETLKH
jgi:uncharacterized ion transporter superfamily protein YfcC